MYILFFFFLLYHKKSLCLRLYVYVIPPDPVKNKKIRIFQFQKSIILRKIFSNT